MEKLKEEIPFLEDKLEQLVTLLGPTPYSDVPPSILLFGDSATGKTLLLEKFFSMDSFAFASVNCLNAYDMKIVYEDVLNQLLGHRMTSTNGFKPARRCDSMLAFVTELKALEKNGLGTPEGRSIIIVFDMCERLVDDGVHPNVFPALARLQELTGLKLCVIFVSTMPWCYFAPAEYAPDPVSMFFETYDQKQLLKILSLSKPVEVSKQFYDNFLNLFLSVFYNASHHLGELKCQAKHVFRYYYEPIAKGELTESDVAKLWKRSQGFFNESLHSLYLKMDATTKMSDFENVSATSQHLEMELPFFSKYILIAAYIASYNPAKEDGRIFERNSKKRKKYAKSKSERVKLHHIGPKPFSLQRLSAIVQAIVDDETFSVDADFFIQVANLVRMKLLTQISEDVLDAPTYKCNCNLQFIEMIAKNVQFPIKEYLVDFMGV